MSQQRAVLTRRGIIVAAAEVFDERGYEGASTAEIQARGGITRGALYFHFPSKATMADAVVATQDPGFAAPGNPVRLQAAVDLCLDYVHRLGADVLLRAAVRLTTERSSFQPKARPHDRLHGLLEDLFTQAGKRGELLPTAGPTELAGVVRAALAGMSLVDPGETAAALPARLAVFWRYLLPAVAMPGVLAHLAVGGSDAVR